MLYSILTIWLAAAPVQTGASEARLCRGDAGPRPSAAPAVSAPIARISWLVGSWVGASGSEERWTTPASGSMIGVGRTLRKGEMVEFEFLCIVERGGTLVYQAMPGARMPATEFTLSAIEPAAVTFENPTHDFPKRIRYSLQPDGTLEAVTSGEPGSRSFTFRFKRHEP